MYMPLCLGNSRYPAVVGALGEPGTGHGDRGSANRSPGIPIIAVIRAHRWHLRHPRRRRASAFSASRSFVVVVVVSSTQISSSHFQFHLRTSRWSSSPGYRETESRGRGKDLRWDLRWDLPCSWEIYMRSWVGKESLGRRRLTRLPSLIFVECMKDLRLDCQCVFSVTCFFFFFWLHWLAADRMTDFFRRNWLYFICNLMRQYLVLCGVDRPWLSFNTSTMECQLLFGCSKESCEISCDSDIWKLQKLHYLCRWWLLNMTKT